MNEERRRRPFRREKPVSRKKKIKGKNVKGPALVKNYEGTVLPFPEHKTLERRDIKFIIYTKQLTSIFRIFSKELAITFLLIVIAGLMTTAIHAHITNLQREIVRGEAYLRSYQDANRALSEQLAGRYSLYEIERIALERLDMAFPDPSQIIHINVQPQDTVMMNAAEHVLPQENYFWQDIAAFVRGVINRIFGGDA